MPPEVGVVEEVDQHLAIAHIEGHIGHGYRKATALFSEDSVAALVTTDVSDLVLGLCGGDAPGTVLQVVALANYEMLCQRS